MKARVKVRVRVNEKACFSIHFRTIKNSNYKHTTKTTTTITMTTSTIAEQQLQETLLLLQP